MALEQKWPPAVRRMHLILDVIGISLVMAVMNWHGFDLKMSIIGVLEYLLISVYFPIRPRVKRR